MITDSGIYEKIMGKKVDIYNSNVRKSNDFQWCEIEMNNIKKTFPNSYEHKTFKLYFKVQCAEII